MKLWRFKSVCQYENFIVYVNMIMLKGNHDFDNEEKIIIFVLAELRTNENNLLHCIVQYNFIQFSSRSSSIVL